MFDGMRIDKMVIHEVLRRDAGGNAFDPVFSDSLSPLPAEGEDAFRLRVVEVMGKPGKSVELTITRADPGSAVHAAQSLRDATAGQFIARSRAVAELLVRAQSNRTMPGGILVVFSGVSGNPARSMIGYLKAEPHSGFTRNTVGGHMTLEYIKEILLTKATRFYKVGIFVAPLREPRAAFPAGWQAFVYDDQIVGSARDTASRYFYEAFLGCDFPENAARLVRDFYRHSKDYIRSMPVTEERKIDLYNALVSYLKVDQAATIQVTEFANRFFADRRIVTEYEEFMTERNVPTVAMIKDLNEVRNELKLRKLRFSNQISLTGPAEQFASMVSVESIDGDIGQDGDPAAWTLITVRDHIRSQE